MHVPIKRAVEKSERASEKQARQTLSLLKRAKRVPNKPAVAKLQEVDVMF